MAAAEKFGAQEVRLEPPGAGDGDGRFRRHPHITGLVAGKRFRFPVPLRLKDTPRRWLNYFTKLRRLLIELGVTPVANSPANGIARRGRKVRRPRLIQGLPRQPASPTGPTRLSRDPWAPLRAVQERLSAAQNHPIYAARGNEQPFLQDLVEADPPAGGLDALLADLNGEHDPDKE
jgi:hypothetical protein